MEIKILVEKSLNDVLPVCVICEAHELEEIRQREAAEEAKREEIRRKSEINSRIYESKILEKINKALIEWGSCTITIGAFSKSMIYNHFIELSQFRDNLIKRVTGQELYDFIYQQYKDAGYNINHYVYSPSYWKDEYITIFAQCKEKE